MQMDEQLIALVTQKVLEALGQNAPAANEAETPEGAVKGIQGPAMLLSEKEEAKPGSTPDEVVIGIAPAFALSQKETICGLSHADVLREITAGIEEEGLRTRYVRFRDISDVSFIAQRAAKLSGSGIGIGIQSKGTAVIPPKGSLPFDQPGAVPSGAADHAGYLPSNRQKRRPVCQRAVAGAHRGHQRLYGAAEIPGPRRDSPYQGNRACTGRRASCRTGGEVAGWLISSMNWWRRSPGT